MLRIYNTLSKQVEKFVPLEVGKVKMYVCGPTVYDFCHLGHGKSYVSFDVIRRYLEYKGYDVTYVENITDVDDKIINRAKEVGEKPEEIAEKFAQEFFKDIEALGIKPADVYPCVSKHIKEIIDLIEKLIKAGYAYEAEGDVYFDVRKFKKYGRLSGQSLKDMKAGARVEPGKGKKYPLDFALWKKSKPGEPKWKSPWGMGRPGWHIECSAMSMKYLGKTFDIHGGGQDLIFPHHENEIAQSEAATKSKFVRYWLHNGFVTINKEKMSKSLGNFFTLREIFEKYDPEIVRFFLIKSHYQSPIDFSDVLLEQAKESLISLYITRDRLLDALDSAKEVPCKDSQLLTKIRLCKTKFIQAMDDNFNTPVAFSHLFDLSNLINAYLDKPKTKNKATLLSLYSTFKELTDILNILWKKRSVLSSEVKKLIKMRETARQKGDYETSDRLRLKLKKLGIQLEDTPKGVVWRRIYFS